MRAVEVWVQMYKPGTTVWQHGRPYTIDHTILRNQQLLLNLAETGETILAEDANVAPTLYTIYTDAKIKGSWNGASD